MQLRATTSFLFMLGAAVALGACGGDDEEDAPSKTPATCRDICARQNTLCSDDDNCAAICPVIEDTNNRSGCADEFQLGLDCLSDADVCDNMSTTCPAQSYDACLATWCASNPTELVCQ